MTTRAERRSSLLIVGSGAVVAALLALVLFAGGGADESVSPAAVPAPPPPPSVAAEPPPAAAAPVSAQGLRLYGVGGAGAIIGLPDGGQRLIPVGRDVLPGLTLASVGVDHAMLRSTAATYQLGFEGVAAGQAGPAGSGQGQPQGGEAALRTETLRYRMGLQPVATAGGVTGHVVRAGAPMPALERTGLRPGDVIRRVNGAEFNGEQREELAWTMANSSEVTFEISRDGRPLRLVTAR